MNFEEFKKIRKIAGLNQKDFGQSLGLSQSQISEIEAGKTRIPKSVIILIEIRYLKKENQEMEKPADLAICQEEKSDHKKIIDMMNGVAIDQINLILKEMPELAKFALEGLVLIQKIMSRERELQREVERKKLERERESKKERINKHS